jgi:hypothetical protein
MTTTPPLDSPSRERFKRGFPKYPFPLGHPGRDFLTRFFKTALLYNKPDMLLIKSHNVVLGGEYL